MRLRHALRADLETVVDVWVDAFSEDPYLRWIAPDDTRWSEFGPAWMTFVAGLTFERGHLYLGDPADVAIAWIPPDLSLVESGGVARGRAILARYAGEARAEAAFATIMAARAHDIEQPHWTLQYLGVRAARQGSGAGAAAVAPGLRTCDAETLPCGLVSSNPRNVPFYERHGFRVHAEVATPDGAAAMRPMRRPPGSVG